MAGILYLRVAGIWILVAKTVAAIELNSARYCYRVTLCI